MVLPALLSSQDYKESATSQVSIHIPVESESGFWRLDPTTAANISRNHPDLQLAPMPPETLASTENYTTAYPRIHVHYYIDALITKTSLSIR